MSPSSVLSDAPVESRSTRHDSQRKRHRSARACLSCRARKVRCDVARRGAPCTNCCMDEKKCVVSDRRTDVEMSIGCEYKGTCNTRSPQYESNQYEMVGTAVDALSWPISSIYNLLSGCTPTAAKHPRTGPWRDSQPVVIYTYYRFLSADDLDSCPPEDLNYLESQGCFHIPEREHLDQLVQQYFLHVHPILPLLSESDFWKIYNQQEQPVEQKFSLLVLQALMFSSAGFVSPECLESMGYGTGRTARAAFYRKAKLLHDFGVEPSPLAIAQAALLLSYSTPPSKPHTKPNSMWLSVAIQNAKTIGADCYSIQSNISTRMSETGSLNSLKRLWWCCIIRDRILSLSVRRSIQITDAHFDFEHSPRLSLEDFEDEIHKSLVYEPKVKHELFEIFFQVVELCLVLTDTLSLVLPSHPSHNLHGDPKVECARMQKNEAALWCWHKIATAKTASRVGSRFQHESSILYRCLMMTYFHAARLALSHPQLLTYATRTANTKARKGDVQRIRDSSNEIQDAAACMAECIERLHKLRLTKWLPLSVVANIAFPLTLHVLNVQLSASSTKTSSHMGTLQRKQSLGILIEAMKVLQTEYHEVEWLATAIRNVVRLVHYNSLGSKQTVFDWTGLLKVHPQRYLQLSIAIDLALSSGQFPTSEEFPAQLQ
ncbi:hypothetical protein BKA56DRAFT_478708, partial [Ilyonectria sp. MPI-CAGE-AT-0026]